MPQEIEVFAADSTELNNRTTRVSTGSRVFFLPLHRGSKLATSPADTYLSTYFVAKMQPILTRMLVLLIAVFPAVAAEFDLQAAYSDVVSGPLSLTRHESIPLPDGCVGQIIEHVTEGSITPPDDQGNPTGGDRLLTLPGHSGVFNVNGVERFGAAGYFVLDPGLSAADVPQHPIYLRIWNAAEFAQATLYYETPLYSISEGIQQVNFARAQLACHDVQQGAELKPLDDSLIGATPAVPLAYNVLTGYPNPFNAEATLSFALERNAHVLINVYDVQGRHVQTLVNDILPAGAHRFSFNAAELTSGTYFAAQRVDGAPLSTIRMMLIK